MQQLWKHASVILVVAALAAAALVTQRYFNSTRIPAQLPRETRSIESTQPTVTRHPSIEAVRPGWVDGAAPRSPRYRDEAPQPHTPRHDGHTATPLVTDPITPAPRLPELRSNDPTAPPYPTGQRLPGGTPQRRLRNIPPASGVAPSAPDPAPDPARDETARDAPAREETSARERESDEPAGQQAGRGGTTVHYTIANDSFWDIAKAAYGDGKYYKALFLHNRDRIARPDRLDAGVAVSIPSLADLQRRFGAHIPR